MPKNWRMLPLISEFIQLNLQQLLEMDIQLHVHLWLRQLLVSISMSWGKFNLKLNFKNHKDWQFISLGIYCWDFVRDDNQRYYSIMRWHLVVYEVDHISVHIKRSIFQTFWKAYNCTIFSFFEIETSNFGSSYVFLSPLKWQGRIWPNFTFWPQKGHISGKCRF